MNNNYDIVIVGGGITGTALLYMLSRYTDVPNIALLEKYGSVAEVNSNNVNNSQTLHFGDIETNYNREKAVRVKAAAELVARYIEKECPDCFRKTHKMVIGMGDGQVKELTEHFNDVSPLFPKLKKIEGQAIAQLEPNVIKGRDPREKIIALVTEDGYAVNFKKLSESFVGKARATGKHVDIFLNTKVTTIVKTQDGYRVGTEQGEYSARAVAVASGAHSLLFAHKLGYGKEFTQLSVVGGFYIGRNLLRGKVYRVQTKRLPFVAIHGDPDVDDPQKTRFGPTGKVIFLLERYNYGTLFAFLKITARNVRAIFAAFSLLLDPVIAKYLIKNLLYHVPLLGKTLFLRQVRSIVPTAKSSDVHYARKEGGIRPQVVNITARKLEMSAVKILGDRILFDITPSPGASVCLKNAEESAMAIVQFFGGRFHFHNKQWNEDFALLR